LIVLKLSTASESIGYVIMRNDLAPGGRNCPLLGKVLRASPAVLSMWHLRNCFSHPSLVMYSFATPRIKLQLGQHIGGGLRIANHMDQSLWWANQKHWAAVRSYLVHSFLQVHSAAESFTSHGNLPSYAEPKPISWVKPAYVGFSSSILTVQDHILSTVGDALSSTVCPDLKILARDRVEFCFCPKQVQYIFLNSPLLLVDLVLYVS
jgi:hypothetical protein